jgi:sec-independent protein translocase protein TatB
MFGLSFVHLVLLAIIVLVFIGPEQLPDVARTFARLLNEWKRASSDIQSSLTNTFKEDLNLHKMIEPKLDAKETGHIDAAPVMPVVKPADHIVQGPTIVHDPHAPPPVNTGHTEPALRPESAEPILPAGQKPSGDSHS